MSVDPVLEASYNANIFSVSPNSSSIILKNDNGTVPGILPNYYIWNIGRSEVYAEVISGTQVKWTGTVSNKTLKPREFAELSNNRQPYYVLALRVHNRTDVRAIVHASNAPYRNYPLYVDHKDKIDFAFHKLMQECITFGAQYMLLNRPFGQSFPEIVKAFWPEDQPSAWEQIQPIINKLTEPKMQETVAAIIQGDIANYKKRLDALLTQMENNSEEVAGTFMSIAEDLVEFENKFKVGQDQPDHEKTNYSLLPIYSTTVTLKVVFYCRAITQARDLGLTESNVEDIKGMLTKMLHDLDGAINYIIDMFTERATNVYNTAYPEDLYNMIMNTRSFVVIFGVEFICKWKDMYRHPTSDGIVYSSVVSFSQFYGPQSPDLYRKALPIHVPGPLTPHMGVGGDKLIEVTIVSADENKFLISGLIVTFENMDAYPLGGYSHTWDREDLEFNGACLVKLVAKGREFLQRLIFILSDGREVQVGSEDCEYSTTFEMKNHYIAGIYATSGCQENQIANIAVSYRRNDKVL